MTIPIFISSEGWKLNPPMSSQRVAPPSVTLSAGTNATIASRITGNT